LAVGPVSARVEPAEKNEVNVLCFAGDEVDFEGESGGVLTFGTGADDSGGGPITFVTGWSVFLGDGECVSASNKAEESTGADVVVHFELRGIEDFDDFLTSPSSPLSTMSSSSSGRSVENEVFVL
jgi:hypothetical protein